MSGYYLSNILYPCDISEVCAEIEALTGIRMKNAPSGISISKTFDGYTYRQVVGFIAGLDGKFATFDRDGVLDFKWYTTTDYSVELNRSFDDVVVQENVFQVGYISCAVDENNTIKSGQGLTGIATSNFLMTQEILDGLGKQNIENILSDIKQDVDNVRDEITTLLRIESSRGTVFKNNAVSTVLSVVIYHGKDRITDIDKLHETYGSSAYIQWKWQRLDEESYGIISSADSRMGNDGFSFTLSPEDVDTKVTFMCELITD